MKPVKESELHSANSSELGNADSKRNRRLLQKGEAEESAANAVQFWPRALDSDEEEDESTGFSVSKRRKKMSQIGPRRGQPNRDESTAQQCRTKNVDDESGTVEWVQCEAPGCGKWRLLPSTVKAKDLPAQFNCAMNFWNPEESSCAVPEAPAAASACTDEAKPGELLNDVKQQLSVADRMANAKRKREAAVQVAEPSAALGSASCSKQTLSVPDCPGPGETSSKKPQSAAEENDTQTNVQDKAMADSLSALAANRRVLDRLSLELLQKDEAALRRALKPLALSAGTVDFLAGRRSPGDRDAGKTPAKSIPQTVPTLGALSEALCFYDVDKIGRSAAHYPFGSCSDACILQILDVFSRVPERC
eukprot:SAG31_NODE_1444_length_8321_cov_2.478716_6_plen_363_part_00